MTQKRPLQQQQNIIKQKRVQINGTTVLFAWAIIMCMRYPNHRVIEAVLVCKTLYTSVRVSSEYDSLDIMTDLWHQYMTNKHQIDLRPFNTNDDLCFVDIANNGVANMDGLSLQRAHADIQHCLDQLVYHNGAEIWVAQGIYVPKIIASYKSSQGQILIIDRSLLKRKKDELDLHRICVIFENTIAEHGSK
eukprot:63877_1